MYDVLSSKKKELKRLPSLKFRRSKSEIFCPPKLVPVEPAIFEAASLLVTSYSQHAIDLPLIAIDVSGVFILVLAKSLSIQKFILGKVCLKAVVKVPLSLQRLASARK